jgi:hypothetical protein
VSVLLAVVFLVEEDLKDPAISNGSLTPNNPGTLKTFCCSNFLIQKKYKATH